jgi:hypothetical protein
MGLLDGYLCNLHFKRGIGTLDPLAHTLIMISPRSKK